MKKFNIGDRVILKKDFDDGYGMKIAKCCQGEIIGEVDIDLCVEFDKNIGGHDGNAVRDVKGKSGHCWWFVKSRFGSTFDLIPKSTQKLIVTVNGAETLARLYEGNKVIKSATAKCSPDDTFDFEKGAKLAVDRLLGKPEHFAKEAPQYYNGKVVCVSVKRKHVAYTVGKIYEFKDGRVRIDNNAILPSNDKDAVTSLDDWNSRDYLWAEFIPLVEN